MIEELTIKGLVEEIDGARVISIKDFKTPLMLVKRDGGFTYSTTDMAALWCVILVVYIYIYIYLIFFDFLRLYLQSELAYYAKICLAQVSA